VEKMKSGYFGMLVAAGYCTLGLIIKAVIDLGFREWKSAGRSLLLWLFGMGVLGVAFGFAVLYDYFG
jgi:hypothetical protein